MKIIIIVLLLTSFFYTKGQELLDTTYTVEGRNISLKSNDLGGFQIQLNYLEKDKKLSFDTLNDSNAIAYFEMLLFDNDLYPDLISCYLGNNPCYILYLFDSKTNTFRKVEEFHHFPNSRRLKNRPEYYYSYSSSGCADLVWASDLFKLENFRITHLGHIYGFGCEADLENEPQYIRVYTVDITGKQEVFETLNYEQSISKSIDKFDLIENYWNKNARKIEYRFTPH